MAGEVLAAATRWRIVMKKLVSTLILGGLVALGAIALQPSTVSADGTACFRTKFETKLTEDACQKGGQEAAKQAWKDWLATAKKTDASLSCKTCHTKLGPEFPLTADGLATYKKAGGK